MSLGDLERRVRRLELKLQARESDPDYQAILEADARTAQRVIAKMGGEPVDFEDSEELAARDAKLLDRYDNDAGEAERVRLKLLEFAKRGGSGV